MTCVWITVVVTSEWQNVRIESVAYVFRLNC